jgi:hypothetical protein
VVVHHGGCRTLNPSEGKQERREDRCGCESREERRLAGLVVGRYGLGPDDGVVLVLP